MSANLSQVQVGLYLEKLLVWASALFAMQFGFITPEPIGHGVSTVGTLFCVAAAFFSFRRGASYYEYQIEDVVAHFAVMRHRLTTQAVSSLTNSKQHS